MEQPPTIRPATVADGKTVEAVFHEARTDSLGFLPVLHTRDEAEVFFTGVCARPETWVAVDADDDVVAFTAFAGGMIEHLYVRPGAQNRGIGAGLFAILEQQHPEGFEFYVFQRNHRARRFYERRGCRPLRFGRANEENEPDVRYRWERPLPG